MISDTHKVFIDGKRYVSIEEIYDDIDKHLTQEMKDIQEDDKYGFDVARHETLCRLTKYFIG